MSLTDRGHTHLHTRTKCVSTGRQMHGRVCPGQCRRGVHSRVHMRPWLLLHTHTLHTHTHTQTHHTHTHTHTHTGTHTGSLSLSASLSLSHTKCPIQDVKCTDGFALGNAGEACIPGSTCVPGYCCTRVQPIVVPCSSMPPQLCTAGGMCVCGCACVYVVCVSLR